MNREDELQEEIVVKKPRTKWKFIVGIIVTLLLVTVALGVYGYYTTPSETFVYYPGESIEVTEVINHSGIDNYKIVTVQMEYASSRSEFYRITDEIDSGAPYFYLIESKGEEMTEILDETYEADLAATQESIDSIKNYANQHYDVAEAKEWLEPYNFNEEFMGDSATLLQTLILEGIYQQKEWLDTDMTIGITGDLDADGTVLEVGAVDLKAYALARENIDVFILPQSQLEEAKTFLTAVDDIQIVGVETMEEAMQWLEENVE